jgi:hypothetical protein
MIPITTRKPMCISMVGGAGITRTTTTGAGPPAGAHRGGGSITHITIPGTGIRGIRPVTTGAVGTMIGVIGRDIITTTTTTTAIGTPTIPQRANATAVARIPRV